MHLNWQGFVESLEHLTGFVIVMIALGGLWGLTALMAKVVALVEKPRTPAPAPAGAAPVASTDAVHAGTNGRGPAPASAETGPSEEELVVVAAAVAAVLGARHRVVAVKPLASSWGQQGRRDIHASHRIR